MAGIGDLVTNLTVNSNPFRAGLDGARASLRSFVGGIGGLIAPAVGTLAGLWGGSESISAFKGALQAQRTFQAVLDATGNSAGITTDEISDYADSLQRVTNFDADDTIKAAAALASFGNIRGDNLKQALAVAQDMATVMGTDLDSQVKKLGKSFKDLTPDEITTKLSELQSRFGGSAAALADPWAQLQFTLGDVSENIGAVLTPSVDTATQYLTQMLSTVASGGDYFKSLGIESAVVLSNMQGLITITALQWELFFVKAGLDAQHFFISELPVWAEWAFDNSGKLLVDFGNLHLTVFENISKNIKTIWQGILDYFSGNPVEFDFTPLTEGFKSTIDKLPDIPQRMTSDFERGLTEDIDRLTAKVGQEMQAQRVQLEERFSVKPRITAEKAFTGQQDEKTTKPTFTTAFRGSQEAATIALRGQDKSTQLQKLAQDQLTELRRIADNTNPDNNDPDMVADF